MRIAYLDHSYHLQTRSTFFFLEMLQKHGDVDEIWDESWEGGTTPDYEAVVARGYDLIVVFQMEQAVREIVRLGAPNVVFIPMWDGCQHLGDDYWRSLGNTRIVSFSRFLHEKLCRLGNNSTYFQYARSPDEFKPATNFSSLRGFFWHRRDELTWRHVSQLVKGTQFDSFQLHGAVDPGCKPLVEPTGEERKRYGMSVSTWFESKAEFLQTLHDANVFFAPRVAEGIGQSFLEALAMGMCVVAPDRPTMNEYIVHGVNGLLFDPDAPAALDFKDAAEMGRRARENAQIAHEIWGHDYQNRLVEFVLSAPALRTGKYLTHGAYVFDRTIDDHRVAPEPERLNGVAKENTPEQQGRTQGGRRTRGVTRKLLNGAATTPRVTVATVTFNAQEGLEHTLLRNFAQDYENVEFIVVDGCSTDATCAILERYDDALDYWDSQRDNGPFDAMNRAAEIATGDYIIFMNAGDWFTAPTTLSHVMRYAERGADFIIGNHIYRDEAGVDVQHRAASFDQTWENLCAGTIDVRWLQGIPCHQATLTRTELLCEHKYDTHYGVAADHDFMYRMRAAGAHFSHINQTVATYSSGGLSLQNHMQCVDEWWQMTRQHGDTTKIDTFFVNSKRNMLRAGQGKIIGNVARASLKYRLLEKPARWARIRREMKVLADSALFFEEWYRDENPDLADSNLSPAEHYLTLGAGEGRNPSPFFDTEFYLALYDDVRNQGKNPLLHYITHGAKENRAPNAWFDIEKHLPAGMPQGSHLTPLAEYLRTLAHEN